MSTPAPASVLAPKPHYAALDGLRGVAAVMVVLFHMFEGSARDFQFHTDQIINHGYLSVDFFFMLSGFVIGYAYDDRWEKEPVELLQAAAGAPSTHGGHGDAAGGNPLLLPGV